MSQEGILKQLPLLTFDDLQKYVFYKNEILLDRYSAWLKYSKIVFSFITLLSYILAYMVLKICKYISKILKKTLIWLKILLQ